MRKKLEQQRALMEAVIQSSEGPIFSVDCDYCYTSFNLAHKNVMRQLYGADIEIGSNILDHHTNPDDRGHAKQNIDRAFRGESFSVEAFAGDQSRSRSYFLTSHNPVKDSNGKVNGVAVYAQDFTARKMAEEELKRANRTLQALSHNNWAMRHAKDETEYLEEVCKIITEDCGHSMVWIGFAANDKSKTVRPVAYSGFEEGYLEKISISWADSERGRGPTGTAIRTGQICTCRNMQTDPKFKPWREEAIKRGYASSLVLPLMDDNKAFGALTIYSRELDPFRGDEIKLLADLVDDLSYGIMTIRLSKAKSKAEKALQESEKRYHSLYSSMNEGVAIHEIIYNSQQEPVDYTITDANKAYEQITGLKRIEIIGKRASEIYGTANPPYMEFYAPVAETGTPTFFDSYFEPMDKHFHISVICTEKGKFATFFEDITENKRDEEKLQSTMENLKRSNQELEQFAYVASHDLQEPLRMVASFTQLLEMRYKDKLDKEGLEYIDFAVEGAKRMQNLINDLLAYSRVTSNAKEFEEVNLEKVLDEVLFNLEIAIEENNAVITREKLPMIHTDYLQIVQVFQNLIGNAIKYRGKETPEIQISARNKSDYWLFSFKDNGIGMEPDNFNQIFQIFRRLHTKDEYGGTGIGLAICKRIVERQGGRIWVESEPGNGSTFYFTIPK